MRSDWGQSLLNLGVTLERLGRKDESEAAYLKALRVDPNSAQPHYNLAVLYWNRDWARAAEHLRSSLKIDPNHAQAREYLPKALYALEMNSKKR